MRSTRWLTVAVTGGALLVIGVASLSDSIFKGPIGKILGFLLGIGLRIVPGAGAFTAGGPLDIPFGKDTLAHFAAWSIVGFIAAGVFRRRSWRFALFVALFVLSALIEVGQQYLSWSRSAEFSDLVANGIGLMVGFTAFTALEAALRFVVPDFEVKKQQWMRQLRSL